MGAKPSEKANYIFTSDFFNEHYVKNKLSFYQIRDLVKSQFGFEMDTTQIRRRALAFGIKTRNKSEANILRAACDYSVSFLNESLLEWIDGFLLGDGYIKPSSVGCAYGCTVQYEEFCHYLMSGLECYKPTFRQKPVYDNRLKNGFTITNIGTTKYHPDTRVQLKRWYPYEKKIVPEDVRITPLSTLLWFLGDGSHRKRKDSKEMILCTNGFSVENIQDILMVKLAAIGIKSSILKEHRGEYPEYMIRIVSSSIDDFLGFMLPNPMKCYKYKFTGMRKSDFIKQ